MSDTLEISAERAARVAVARLISLGWVSRDWEARATEAAAEAIQEDQDAWEARFGLPEGWDGGIQPGNLKQGLSR